ncbi:hypothetical protein EDC44_1182 [Cricetibacter osteomyelitidis]|uniref:DUF1643 domain-containing protein n=1 Tax=Cricetibacter osteomyelitidis TaxID=1521931 RepID=A0A4V2T1H2_9PAST|nr:DUF1643 domain-containing protein [Cricetibacter osteomyelitidis]TCP93453.1 hypothetical protein EDC44_1182 [Cricetibacter osteomyelitidis]
MLNPQIESGAILSDDRQYRYVLWRIWDPLKPMVTFIGLNPSTADEKENDPTIIQCINFAKYWGYGGIYMLNLFAYRSTDKSKLSQVENPIGAENDRYFMEYADKAEKIIAAWGNDGSYLNRSKQVCELLNKPLFALKINSSGEPHHPLYIPIDIEPEIYSH